MATMRYVCISESIEIIFICWNVLKKLEKEMYIILAKVVKVNNVDITVLPLKRINAICFDNKRSIIEVIMPTNSNKNVIE